MASFTLHNVKSAAVQLRDHETFCTLHLDINTQSEYDNEPIYEKIDLFFDTIETRTAFILSLYNADQQ